MPFVNVPRTARLGGFPSAPGAKDEATATDAASTATAKPRLGGCMSAYLLPDGTGRSVSSATRASDLGSGTGLAAGRGSAPRVGARNASGPVDSRLDEAGVVG